MGANAPAASGIIRKDLLYLCAFYALGHLGIFLVADAVFWDDWSIYGNAFPVLLDASWSAGKPWDAYFRTLILSLGLPSARVMSFVSHLVAGLCLYGILQRTGGVLQSHRLLICVLFLLLPFFLARTAFILTWYSLTNAAFFAGWLLLVLESNRARLLVHLAACLLFVVSFTTPSHLVFYALPVMHLFFVRESGLHPAAIVRFVKQHPHLLILPVAFYILKGTYFAPSGGYANYNEIRLKYLLDRSLVPLVVIRNLFRLISTVEFLPLFIALLITTPLVWVGIARTSLNHLLRSSASLPVALLLVVLGGFCYLLGLFPYLVVNETPLFIDWSSRHQLLLPLGVSIGVVGVLLMVPGRIRVAAATAILSVSLALSWMSYGEYARDWIKQEALIAEIAGNDEIRRGRTFQVVDGLPDYNAKQRAYRVYEYNGFMRAAFEGEQTRLAGDLKLWEQEGAGYLRNRNSWAPRWNLTDYRPGVIDCVIHISPGETRLSKGSAAIARFKTLLSSDRNSSTPTGDLLSVDCR